MSTADWATKAAEEIINGHEYHLDEPKQIASIIAAHAEPLVALLRESKREHYHCDDSWYCCRACRCPDHVLEDGEHLDEGHDGPGGDGRCTCGADAWNARVDDALDGSVGLARRAESGPGKG